SRFFKEPFVFEASRTLKSRGTQMARRHPRSFGLMKARPHREDKHLYSFIIRPTLSQMWPEREAGPPFTFKISMLHVFCSSHGLAHFAALFIDPRA
ncbi:hypothetical protein YC68_23620, partial [Vibrio parahaemolyticus]